MNKKGLKSKFWRYLLITYIVLLHSILTFLIIKTDFLPKLKSLFASDLILSDHVKNMLIYHASIDELVPDNSAIFLGDSFTQGLATAAVAPYATNFGIGGETTDQLLHALPTYQSIKRSRSIYLLIGVNDLVLNRMSGLKERLYQISITLPENKPLIWSTIMPSFNEKLKQADIDAVNRDIKSLCQMRRNCTLLDATYLFDEPEEKSISKYFEIDGIHLNAGGYKKWIAALKSINDSIELNH